MIKSAKSNRPICEKGSLDRGWRFFEGDIPFPPIRGHSQTYANAKAGVAWGAAAQAFDDTTWRQVDLPHDWAVEQPIVPDANLSQGFRRRGIGWYRRHFALSEAERNRHLELQFDGIANHATVWVNGMLMHRNWCGYTSFYLDISPLARFGDELNTIAIRVDADAQEGWWYEGAGIYRHTWLASRNATHIITDGVYADPVHHGGDRWTIPVEVLLNHSGVGDVDVAVQSTLRADDGRVIDQSQSAVTVAELRQGIATLTLNAHSPQRWSVSAPTLYRVETRLLKDGTEIDAVTTTCGFRTLRFDAENGFFLNDQPLKLQGVCCHQDHAGVGVALPDSLWEFRVRKLKEMGVNAYRCAHNPPPVEFLDCCDRLGILVMDENRHFNSSPEYIRQLQWLVRRDRNHPCVMLWSVFNEEPMQGTSSGFEMVRRMVAVVKELDQTRPVTAAMNGGLFTEVNVSQAVDVVGFNYQIEAYDRFHEANPTIPLTSSEDTSAFMTRGNYITDLSRNLIDAYDDQAAPWGATHRAAWKAIATRPYLAGGFVWTGFDYRGEPTPLQWPSASSFFGCMDLCGFPKTAFFIHQAQWGHKSPVLHIAPHWNWHGREGEQIRVLVISNAQTVSLSLNGKTHGEQTVNPYELNLWHVPYAPGLLEAIAKSGGREVARTAIETSQAPAALELIPDRPTLDADGQDAQPVTVRAVDAAGRCVPTANAQVTFSISRQGRIIGLGNGDPNCHEPDKGTVRSLFNGLAQVIIQSSEHTAGPCTLQATAPGLASAHTTIQMIAAPSPRQISAMDPTMSVQDWRMSPYTMDRPDPNVYVAENDMNTWVSIQPGELQSFVGGCWAIYRATFTPFASVQARGGRIVFGGITGQFSVWLDGQPLALSPNPDGSLAADMPPADHERTLNVLIETQRGQSAGLIERVIVESHR